MVAETFLNEVISCPKHVIKADRKRMVLENRHYKNKLDIISEDGKYTFKMFMRQSNEFLEDFSVGLIWTNPQKYINISKNIILLRCQGPHDGRQELGSDIHHDFHIHKISSLDIEEKRYSKPSNRTSTDKFHSFNQALCYFIEKCGILDIEDFIELPFDSIDPNQLTFDESGDPNVGF